MHPAIQAAIDWVPGIKDLRVIPGLQAYYDALVSTSVTASAVTGATSLVGDLSGNSGVNCLVLNKTAGNWASSPNSANIALAGDIDLRVLVQLPTYTPAANAEMFISKLQTDGQSSYEFRIDATTGKLAFRYTPTGAWAGLVTLVSTDATSLAAFSKKWLRATRNAATGDVAFWMSDDNISYTQLGTTVAGTPEALPIKTDVLGLGASVAGGSGNMSGLMFRAQIYDGIPIAEGGAGGTLKFDANFSLATKGANGTTFNESANNAVVTVVGTGATGARISGARDLYQGTGASQPTWLQHQGTNYGWLPGVAANNFNTPSAAANQFTGDIQFDVDLSMVDWTPAVTSAMIGKWDNTTNQKSYELAVNTDGTLALITAVDGAGVTTVTTNSTAATGFADGSRNRVRVTLDVDDGASHNVVNFYTSTDGGVTWPKLGNTVTNAGTTSIYAGTDKLQIGVIRSSATNLQMLAGNVYGAKLYNGIAGTLAVNFSPSEATDGATSWVSSTGETWTVNQSGGKPALIVGRSGWLFDGSNDFLKTAPFALVQPEWVVLVGRQLSWADGDYIYDGVSNDSMSLTQVTSTPRVQGGVFGQYIVNDNFPVGTTAIVTHVLNGTGTSSLLQVNRGPAVTGSQGTAGGGGFTLGAKGNNAAFSNILVNAVAIFSVAPTAAQIDQVVKYFARRWAISV